MLDVQLLRNEPERLEGAFAHRGVDVDVAALADLDRRRRAARADAEEVRAWVAATPQRFDVELGARE